jgi:CBS domain-containing protein
MALAQIARLRPLAALSSLSSLNRTIATSFSPAKASEPAFEHQDDEGSAFQTKIFEVLQLKKEMGAKLWVSDECTVLDAVKKMAANDVGSLLVYDKDKAGPKGDIPQTVDACVGIITERDYLKNIIVKGLSSATTPVSKIMTAADQLAVLTPEHSVLEAMDLMLRYNVRHVPVMDTHAMVGVLSMKDVVRILFEDSKHEIDSLKDYIHGGW